MKSFAQNNEDKIVIDLFFKKNIKNGVFIEFGAWDGVHLSNCKLLADHDWSGFFIEGNSLRFIHLWDINVITKSKISKIPYKDMSEFLFDSRKRMFKYFY